MEPYYQDDYATIYHGDCREVTEWLAADVIITDPPYGINLDTARTVNQPKKDKQGRIRTGKAFTKIAGDDAPFDPAMLLAAGPCCLFGANHYAARLPDGGRWHVWDKTNRGEQPTGLNNEFEVIWTSYPSGRSRIIPYLWAGLTRINRHPDSFQHPTQKPVVLMSMLIQDAPPGVIADPYMGSGSTLVAAKDNGRQCIGIEIEERYCEIAAKRLSQEVLDFGGAA